MELRQTRVNGAPLTLKVSDRLMKRSIKGATKVGSANYPFLLEYELL